MAQKVQVILTDDLDGGPADETLNFTIDGVDYEIDLSERNAEAWRALAGPYILAARRTGGRYVRKAPAAAGTARRTPTGELAAIRGWARDQGMTVSPRGRLSGEIRAAYEAAHA